MRQLLSPFVAILAFIPAASPAQQAAAPEQAVENYRMPRPLDAEIPRYPVSASMAGQEGWVTLNFMVSPEGEAYEVRVLDQAGDGAFVTAAERALQDTSFSPATVGDRPVHGSMTIRYYFALENGARGARAGFVGRYGKFIDALNERTQDEAAEALAMLENEDVHNGYEHAHLSLAKYQFASRYGTPLEQMRYLNEAISEHAEYPEYETFLPEEVATPSRRALFQLMVQNQHLGEAADIWRLMEIRGDEEGLELFHDIHDRLSAFRINDEPYAVEAELNENGSWQLQLFKDDFYLDRVMGTVDEIKLRCQREYVSLAFDPETLYTVSERAGSCSMEVLGVPGASFLLVQQ